MNLKSRQVVAAERAVERLRGVMGDAVDELRGGRVEDAIQLLLNAVDESCTDEWLPVLVSARRYNVAIDEIRALREEIARQHHRWDAMRYERDKGLAQIGLLRSALKDIDAALRAWRAKPAPPADDLPALTEHMRAVEWTLNDAQIQGREALYLTEPGRNDGW